MANEWAGPIEQIDACRYRIPRSYKPGMLVDGIIYADSRLLPSILDDRAAEQVVNVAFLPGIQSASLAMPSSTTNASTRADCDGTRPVCWR